MTTFHITSIEPQKKYPHRRNIYLDNAFAFGLDEEVVLKHHLHVGDTLSEATIQHVLMEEEAVRAKKKALSLLSYRARSVEEIRDRLNQKGYDDRIVNSIVEDFLRVGLLNDESFASAYIQTRMIQRPASKRLLIQELKKKGVKESMAARVVTEGYGEKSEIEVAKSLIELRFKRFRRGDRLKNKKKISDFLIRRGFDWDIINELLRWKEESDSEIT
ncbi:RecX family transcriptional regulator [bacterium]|nr:RecX family transcriptional regulator [bacterium]